MTVAQSTSPDIPLSLSLTQVRSLETAEKFLKTVARFKERVGWHGESAEGWSVNWGRRVHQTPYTQ